MWRRRQVTGGRSGALDMLGTTWRDPPAIDCGHGILLCGDQVVVRDYLAEVSFASAIDAATRAVAHTCSALRPAA